MLSLVACHFCLVVAFLLSANFDGVDGDDDDDGGALAGDLVLVALAFEGAEGVTPLGGLEGAVEEEEEEVFDLPAFLAGEAGGVPEV